MRTAKTLHPVAAARQLRGVTQSDLAAAAGMSQIGVSHIETRYCKTSHPLTQRAIASALGFTVADLWPDPDKGEKVAHELQAIIDGAGADPVARRVRRPRLTAAQIKQRGWSTEKRREYGGASEEVVP